MLETITKIEMKYCRDCALWQLLPDGEREHYSVPEIISVGRCAHGKHMSEDTWECIFVNNFCSIYDYNCETCSREECPLHKQSDKKSGCVNEWMHQLTRFKL